MRRKRPAPGPSALGVHVAQVRVSLVQLRVGSQYGVANGPVHEGPAREISQRAVGAVVLSPERQSPATFEASANDAAIAAARRSTFASEPGDPYRKAAKCHERNRREHEPAASRFTRRLPFSPFRHGSSFTL